MKKDTQMKAPWYWTSLIVGLLSAWLFIDHITGFKFPHYFYNSNPGITSYSGINVVSAWADLSYFTYHTIIFFSVWAICLFIAYAFKLKRLNLFLTHEATVSFILTNYTLTCLLYTVFEVADGKIDFGLYALTNHGIHNFGTNVLAHYVFYAFAVAICLKLKAHGKAKARHLAVIAGYLLIYYLAVKITGKYCYVIEWYPYPIFDAKMLCDMLTLPSNNPGAAACLLGLALFLILAFYIFIYYGIISLKRKIIAKNKSSD